MKPIKAPFFGILILLLLTSCRAKEQADLIVLDSYIQTCDSSLSEVNAMVIGKGKVLAVGDARELLATYQVDSQLSFRGKFIYPGIIDAHCHFYGLGMFLQRVDLSSAKSFDEVVDLCMKFYSKQTTSYLMGRGWDQTKWSGAEFPLNNALNYAFPDIPVLLKRVDGHAAIANDYALQLAGITSKTKVDGGEVLLHGNKPTGVLIDNAVDLVEAIMPKPNYAEKVKALLDAQQVCMDYGLTSLTDAGLDTDIILLIDSLQQAGLLKIRINAMVSLTRSNLDYWLKRGPLFTDRLQVNSFKMYGDGSLGSRGACLKHPYHDQPGHSGFLLTKQDEMEQAMLELSTSPFQLCTHAIGDSTNKLLLDLYGKYVGHQTDRRWRIEHAQVVDPSDFWLFGKYQVVPSVQPTHATSDMPWAAQRLGSERMGGAYAYRTLLAQLGWLPLGTDFPVEAVSPFYTFYAAITRRDKGGNPPQGFGITESLSRREALKGMTCWAARASFQENSIGSLKPGAWADFVVIDKNLLIEKPIDLRNLKAFQAYIQGEQVK